jgi:hypothetical protein
MTLIRLPGPSSFTILADCYLLDEPTDTASTTIDDLYEWLPRDEPAPYRDHSGSFI